MEENKIPEMQPQLELIKKYNQDGKEYWTSRDLCGAMGYTCLLYTSDAADE